MTPSPFADAAVDYAQRGWRVFRIPLGQKIPTDRWAHGADWEVATDDVDEVRRRIASYQGRSYNVGIATGQGLAVLDIDPQHGGKVPSWAPPTLTARTPSGGAHLYYYVDGPVQNSAGVLGQGVDVRGQGGMVLAPPSYIRVGGETVRDAQLDLRYEWVDASATLARTSGAMLNPSGREQAARGPKLAGRRFGEGDRHPAMLTLAGKMRSIGCEFEEIDAALQALNRNRFDPPLDPVWVVKVAKSIMRYAPDSALLP